MRDQDPAAVERLVREQTPRLLAVARRMLRNDSDARDAVQEAFLCAFRSLARFEGACALSTWLHRIVVNAALMKLRSRRRRPEESIEPLLPRFLEDGHHASHPPEWMPADVLLERRETRELVRAAIDRLPDGYRTILLLRDIEELDTEETARAMNQGVYRLAKDGTLTALVKDLGAPNGIGFSPDERTLYVSNAQHSRPIWMAYPVNDDGSLGPGRQFGEASAWVKPEEGVPDGLKVDRNGNVFAAGPGGIHVFAPDGTRLGRLETGVKTGNLNWGEDGSVLFVAANHWILRLRTSTKGKGF